MPGVPESSARLACDFVIAGTSLHSPSDTLDSLVDDDICKHLRRCFFPGRGRPPALPKVQLTNRLLLQLKLLQAEGKKSSKDVSRWFDMLFPDVSYPSTRLSGALDRLEKKVQAVQREDGDIDSFLKTEVDFDFVSSSLSKVQDTCNLPRATTTYQASTNASTSSTFHVIIHVLDGRRGISQSKRLRPHYSCSAQRTPPPTPNAAEHLTGFSWLQTVYVKDVLQRLDDVKASITSTFGHMLKLDLKSYFVVRHDITRLSFALPCTLSFCFRFKTCVTCLERQQLTQHLQMPVPAAPSMPIPLARQQTATLDEGQEDIRHEFKLPKNTAGTGKARRKRAAVKIQAAVPIAPSPSTSIPLLCVPSAQPGSAPILFTLPQKMLSTMERPAEQKPPQQPSAAGTSSMPAPSTPQPQAVYRKVPRTTAWSFQPNEPVLSRVREG
ncbi:hypothetical protein ACOMHN_049190 [Nucella lapillus]